MTKRKAATHLIEFFGASQRQSCKMVNLNRSTYQYKHQSCNDVEIRKMIKELANKYNRFGSPRIHALLRRKGIKINHKKTERIYKEENLSLRTKKHKKKLPEIRVKMPQATGPNEVWSMDFMFDKLFIGSRFKILTIVDDYSKICPGLEVAGSITGSHVTRFLDQISDFYEYPKRIRVDNGPEFRCKEFALWAIERNIKIEYTRPGTPTDNAMIESFNGKLRDECLNQIVFKNIKEAKSIIEDWRTFYNDVRPHSTLGYCTPKEYLEKLALKVA